jgi:hypothetical protein
MGGLANIMSMPAGKAWPSRRGDMALEYRGRRVSSHRMATAGKGCGKCLQRWVILLDAPEWASGSMHDQAYDAIRCPARSKASNPAARPPQSFTTRHGVAGSVK